MPSYDFWGTKKKNTGRGERRAGGESWRGVCSATVPQDFENRSPKRVCRAVLKEVSGQKAGGECARPLCKRTVNLEDRTGCAGKF